MSFAIFAVARRARRRRRSGYPHFSDTRQQLLHALTTLKRAVILVALDGATQGRCIWTDSSGPIFKRIGQCAMFGTTPYFSLPLPRPACATTVEALSSTTRAGHCSQGRTVSRLLQWGCIVTESQMRTTPEQNTGAIRSLSQKYNALTFKKRWFLVGANTYCNDVHREKAPAPASAAILALPMCRIGCAAGEK
jgi:hypothetical protein